MRLQSMNSFTHLNCALENAVQNRSTNATKNRLYESTLTKSLVYTHEAEQKSKLRRRRRRSCCLRSFSVEEREGIESGTTFAGETEKNRKQRT